MQGTVLAGARKHSNSCSIGTVDLEDSEEGGPTAGLAG